MSYVYENYLKTVLVSVYSGRRDYHYTLYNRFKKLGDIENYIILKHDLNDNYNNNALITFESPELANNLLRQSREGYLIEPPVDWLWEQTLTEPYDNKKYDKDSPTPLLSLTTDCLLYISKYLDLFDLIELSKTCKTMKTFVANIVFPNFKRLQLDCHSTKLSIYLLRYFNKITLARCLIDLDIFHIYHHIFIMNLVAKNVYNLQELHLINVRQVIEDLTFKSEQYDFPQKLEQLKVLTLVDCGYVCDNIILVTQNLIELNLDRSPSFHNEAIIQNLQNLQKLSIKNDGFDWTNILKFLKQNNQLTHLTLKNLPKLSINENYDELYSTISNIKSLQYLAVDCLGEWPFENLNCLKSLTFDYKTIRRIPPLKALADKDQLEELEFFLILNSRDEKSVLEQNLLRFTKIHTLNFYYSFIVSKEFLLQLATKWNLISLRCTGSQLSDDAILKIVEVNKNMKYLICADLSPPLIGRIIEIIKNDPERPKLMLFANIDEHVKKCISNYSCGRVEVKGPDPTRWP